MKNKTDNAIYSLKKLCKSPSGKAECRMYYPWTFAFYSRAQFPVPCPQNINFIYVNTNYHKLHNSSLKTAIVSHFQTSSNFSRQVTRWNVKLFVLKYIHLEEYLTGIYNNPCKK